MDENEGSWQNEKENDSSQSIEELLSIVQEARKPAEGPKFGGSFVGGSLELDLDDLEADCDMDDIETSGDFVCALWVLICMCSFAGLVLRKAFVIRSYLNVQRESSRWCWLPFYGRLLSWFVCEKHQGIPVISKLCLAEHVYVTLFFLWEF